MGAIQSTLFAIVYEKKRYLDSSANPINCLQALSNNMIVDFEKAQIAWCFLDWVL
jgi:hypothetical protein